MELVRQVVVFRYRRPARRKHVLTSDSRGYVYDGDGRFHCVFGFSGAWRIGVQLAPDHIPPEWPDGTPNRFISICASRIRERHINRRLPLAPIAPGGSRFQRGRRAPGLRRPSWGPVLHWLGASVLRAACGVRRQAVRTGRRHVRSRTASLSLVQPHRRSPTVHFWQRRWPVQRGRCHRGGGFQSDCPPGLIGNQSAGNQSPSGSVVWPTSMM